MLFVIIEPVSMRYFFLMLFIDIRTMVAGFFVFYRGGFP